ncbi:molybdate ABC transporter substrate-binding protein [Undibacterium cyanobacteriorum]|uniref:Molybdate ABC transporter substrate-binding protein n=1 Tax=Undibacterium cyanobacteriorum TaxID=3073561 RepID=A0ABY9RN91_9BURK|nr:molybdate ABC transporter substrate-binding protein [Undibacterium sp. 20NA77.5]WMW81897.1 molybdate ABC transporter substrate-binding protein [Undibacterium sp. 20NA77.5]
MPRLLFTLKAAALTVLLSHANSCAAEDLHVSAAASLSNAFKDIAQAYQTKYPSTKILLNFGASGALLQQIAKGAPADVFASADQETMDRAQQQNMILAKERINFTRNRLVLIQSNSSTIKLDRLNALQQTSIKRIAVGNPSSVPAGRYAVHALQDAKLHTALEAKLVLATNVRQALDYVARDEVEAGFVYASDAMTMSDRVKVALQIDLKQDISYPIAITTDSKKTAEAKRFIQFLTSAQAQAILKKYGSQNL